MDLDHIKESVNALAETMHEMKQEFKEEMETMQEATQKSAGRRLGRLPMSTKAAMDGQDPAQEAFHSFVRKGDQSGFDTKSLSSSTDAEGGYLIPQIMSSKIIQTMVSKSPFRDRASVTTISSDALEFLVDREAFDAGWATETGNRPETATSKLEKIKIAAHEMYARPRATQKLLDDAAIDIEAWLCEKISNRLSQLENDAFLNGDGHGKPKGIFAYDAVEKDVWRWGRFEQILTGKKGAFADKDGADVLITATERLKTAYHKGACWMMAPSALAAVRRLKDAQGHYVFQHSFEADKPATLLGFPVFLCDEMPALEADKASTSVVFGNFKEAYQIVDRSQVTLMRDPYSAKPFVEFYATKRVGGDVLNFEALKMIRFEDKVETGD